MRVQFTVSTAEWQQLLLKAQDEGYPDVPTYCREVALGERTFQELWSTVVLKIFNMPRDSKPFALRDLVPSPPALLGRKLYEHQDTLKIKCIRKDNTSNIFVKL